MWRKLLAYCILVSLFYLFCKTDEKKETLENLHSSTISDQYQSPNKYKKVLSGIKPIFKQRELFAPVYFENGE